MGVVDRASPWPRWLLVCLFCHWWIGRKDADDQGQRWGGVQRWLTFPVARTKLTGRSGDCGGGGGNAMKTRYVKAIVVVGLLAAVAAYLAAGGRRAYVYRNADIHAAHEYEISREKRPPLHIVKDNQLFLRYQTRRAVSVVLAVYTTQEIWTTDKTAELMATHPELKALVPKPDQPNLGVEWMNVTRQRPEP
jgi:hypothetical protein